MIDRMAALLFLKVPYHNPPPLHPSRVGGGWGRGPFLVSLLLQRSLPVSLYLFAFGTLISGGRM
jgi:hypothetical protein